MTLTVDCEEKYWNLGKTSVIGVDEVGRGSLAGPVVAAAVSFNPGHTPIKGMYDSKCVSPLRRIKLNTLIREQCRHCVVNTVSTEKINTQGIAVATKNAITACLLEFQDIDIALIDGVWAPKMRFPCKTIVRGDTMCYSIAAASIVAKVYRDALMKRLSRKYPYYHWDKNMGYGTSLHRTMIKQHGPTPYHRTLFIRKSLVTANSSNK